MTILPDARRDSHFRRSAFAELLELIQGPGLVSAKIIDAFFACFEPIQLSYSQKDTSTVYELEEENE